jgi:hypothetical protein
MPGARRATAPVLVNAFGYVGRTVELGELTVAFDSFATDVDPAPAFRGLPDDRCPCPHWGVVMSGQLTLRYPDHNETFDAGDVFQALPGHLPLVAAGTDLISFSPPAELRHANEVIVRNIERLMSARS